MCTKSHSPSIRTILLGRKHHLNPMLIKSYMWQLMKSLDHMHKKGIFHRDIKPENILIESSTDVGRGLKLADFGSCRGIYSKQPYTEYISTRWYRAPECLLTNGYYGPEMDLWGAGCVMFEITSLYPLFPGVDEVDQATRIHKVLGSPSPEIIQKFKSKDVTNINLEFPVQKGIGIPKLIPHASPDCIDLIVKLLKYDASERITAREAMRHPYFRDVKEPERKASTVVGVPAITDITRSTEGDNNGTINENTSKDLKSNIGVKSLQGQLSSSLQKALPNILGKGAGQGVGVGTVGSMGVKSIQQQQQQNFVVKASVTGNRSTGVSTLTASTLPPIGGINGGLNTGGSTTHQYGSTVGATAGNRQQKATWQQRRQKSKTGYFTGTAGISPANQTPQAAEQYVQAMVSESGGGVTVSHQQANSKSQVSKAYGAGAARSNAGQKTGGRTAGPSAAAALSKEISLNAKKVQL